MRHTSFVIGLVIVVGWAARGFAEPIQIPERPSQRPLLKSIYCGHHSVSDLIDRDARIIALVFLGTDCPVALQYLPQLKSLHEEFRDRGVRFFGIYPNARDHVLRMASHALDQDIPFPVFVDTDQRLSTLLEVSATPEVVLLDPSLNRLYQGAIDNQFTKRGSLQEASERYLRDAIVAVLNDQPVEKSYVPATGCPLERLGPPVKSTPVTYYKDVAPIIQNRCQGCHRDGGVAPFPLVEYDDAYYSAERIREVVVERRMPPWHGFLNPEFGRIKNDCSLSDDEIGTILSWIDQRGPAGNVQDAPPPIQWPDPKTWTIGEPDYVYRIPEFRVPKNGVLDYQYFRVRLNDPEDRWFRAVEVKPGNPEVVHHVGLHIVPSSDRKFVGFSGMAALYGLNGELARLINDYVPGDLYNAKIYSPGSAVRIPKNSDLIFEVHYTPNNREATTDQSMVGFQWASEAPAEEILTEVFRKPIGRFRIPPFEHHHRMEDTYYFKDDIVVDAIRPHFHYRGKSFRLEMIQRNENTDEITVRKTILSVPVFDQDWQRTYELETPFFVPAGTELLATGIYDNSRFNPKNPDPSATVMWGQQTTDEMFSTRFKYRLATQKERDKYVAQNPKPVTAGQ